MKKLPIHSLAIKIGSVIILVEIVVLSITGGLYINRFSREVDRRFESSIQIPGMLMAEGALKYSLVMNRHRMERLAGGEALDEAILFGVEQQVFYSLTPSWMGKHVKDIPGLNPAWFRKEMTEAFVEYIPEKQEKFLISVTPIFSIDGRPFLFLFLKINTCHAETEKSKITRLFLLGSIGTIIVTSLAIFLIFQRSIFTRIRSLLLLFKRIETGDLTVRSTGRIVPDEIGSVQNGVNSMVGKFQEMMTDLQDSRKRYRAIVGDIPAMICRFLPDGTLTFLNREYARYFRGDAQEMVGQNFFQHLPEDEREQVRANFSSLSLERPLITYTQQLQAQEGHAYWQQWTGRALFNENGKLTEYQALGRDISDEIRAQEEKTELEKQLQTSKKMEAIGTLAGGIAHDFNNILGGIIGYAELAQDEISPDSRTQHYLQQILKACHRAKELVIQILIFSRQGPTERQPLQLESLVKETLKLLKATLPDNINIRYQSSAFASKILANPTQIHQTLMNLYTNATHAMHNTGGILEVAVREIDITEDESVVSSDLQTGPYIELSIGDTGPGMDQEMLQRIFDPYFTTKAPYEGTGLGLSICLGIVKNHGGTITVESAQGEGSTFTMIFPKMQEEPDTENETAKLESLAIHGNERILFVDDEAFLVDIGQDMLEKLGYKVVTARNGQEAFELFQVQPKQFDLVITDQTMPKMTGAELATQLLHIRKDIPIILCTGFSESITEEQAKTLGIQEFILKPISRQEMARQFGTRLTKRNRVFNPRDTRNTRNIQPLSKSSFHNTLSCRIS